MKKYLVKGYLLGKEKDQDWFFHENNFRKKDKDIIEIPEGATIAVHYKRNDKIYFWKGNEIHFVGGYWLDCKLNGLTTLDSFLTNWEGYCTIVWQIHTQPEELPFVDDGDYDKCDSKLGNFVVDDTLNQRQSQYGEFKDVANTTQYLLQMLSNDKMSDVQLESLHMICSKLSRIAHGDPNHVDSWHDIAGYATLVVKDIS